MKNVQIVPTPEDKLQQIIGKAVKNGYEPKFPVAQWFDNDINPETNNRYYPTYADFFQTIFSHDFAKAFWGEAEFEYADNEEKAGFIKRGWRYHLQQMVLEELPIKYLEKFLDTNK